MRFGKGIMFLLLNGVIALGFSFYFGLWLLSNKTIASTIPPYATTTIAVKYEVEGKIYTGSYLRNGIPLGQREVSIRYFLFDPAISRINSFMGIAAEPLAW